MHKLYRNTSPKLRLEDRVPVALELQKGFFMIAICLAPCYLLLCWYLWRRTIRWMGSCHHVFEHKGIQIGMFILYAFLALSIVIAFLLPHSDFQRFLKMVSNYWLGILLYIILTVVVADLLRFILKRIRFPHKEKLFSRGGHAVVGTICLCVICGFSVLGIYTARHTVVTQRDITIEKSGGDLDSLHVVLVADLHLGYSIGNDHMKQMVEKINALDPDVVLVAGDIFDNEFEAIKDPDKVVKTLSGIKSKYGVYATYGNHDIQEPILAGFTFGGKDEKKQSDPRMDAFMQKAGLTLLQEKGVWIDDSVYLYGRPDYERPGRGITKRKTPKEITKNIDKSKPIIVLEHEPRQLQELADAGVDAQLCGHTHDGQMFPGNLTIKPLWENAYGYKKKDGMHSIVTSGVGVFGPNMRVGTKSEIYDIHMTFRP